MENNLIYEINKFKLSVEKEGMTLKEYFEIKKKFIKEIDQLSEKKLGIVQCALFFNRITKDQYIEHKMRIDEQRLKYKRLLSYE